GLVQVDGAIGDDPFYDPGLSPDPFNPDPALNPANDVDLYHFQVRGPGRFALVSEVFAGRIGSPLDPGLSLYRRNPGGSLQSVDGDNQSYNPTSATDGSAPLLNDPVLDAALTEGDYFLAVSSGFNTPSPLEGQPVDAPGGFDPTRSHSGTLGFS